MTSIIFLNIPSKNNICSVVINVKDIGLLKIVIENRFWFRFDVLDAFQQGLHDITVLETETATFECQLIDDSMEGERIWYYKGQKVEASNDKYASIENSFSHSYFLQKNSIEFSSHDIS